MQPIQEVNPRAVVVASGVALYALSPDELTILTGYCMIRAQGGSMVVEFDRDHIPIRWDVKPNLGSPKLLGELIKQRK